MEDDYDDYEEIFDDEIDSQKTKLQENLKEKEDDK